MERTNLVAALEIHRDLIAPHPRAPHPITELIISIFVPRAPDTTILLWRASSEPIAGPPPILVRPEKRDWSYTDANDREADLGRKPGWLPAPEELMDSCPLGDAPPPGNPNDYATSSPEQVYTLQCLASLEGGLTFPASANMYNCGPTAFYDHTYVYPDQLMAVLRAYNLDRRLSITRSPLGYQRPETRYAAHIIMCLRPANILSLIDPSALIVMEKDFFGETRTLSRYNYWTLGAASRDAGWWKVLSDRTERMVQNHSREEVDFGPVDTTTMLRWSSYEGESRLAMLFNEGVVAGMKSSSFCALYGAALRASRGPFLEKLKPSPAFGFRYVREPDNFIAILELSLREEFTPEYYTALRRFLLKADLFGIGETLQLILRLRVIEEDRDPEDSDPEDRDPEDSDPEDRDPEDCDPEDSDPEDRNPEDSDPEDRDPEDCKPEDSEPELLMPISEGSIRAYRIIYDAVAGLPTRRFHEPEDFGLSLRRAGGRHMMSMKPEMLIDILRQWVEATETAVASGSAPAERLSTVMAWADQCRRAHMRRL